MESLIADLDAEAMKSKAATTTNEYHPKMKMTTKSTLSGDTTYDKAQIGMNGPSWTGFTGQGEYKCPVSGLDHHLDELKCDYCRKH
ncbi:unnamed protein product [Rotaria magnacalcarata]|uniref:Uncharacterized protein n=1 Tax=Rotaria magnacalcarata TaxID=392030 RepID=A0A8S2M8P0_9BILA|nr:unnamed protein product [Rotaria magnacalcarata]